MVGWLQGKNDKAQGLVEKCAQSMTVRKQKEKAETKDKNTCLQVTLPGTHHLPIAHSAMNTSMD